jgi:hypothetical protein
LTLDTLLLVLGLVAEGVALSLILYKRVFKTLPLFSSYLLWSLINDSVAFLLIRHYPSSSLQIFFLSTIIDSVFMFCVLIELSMSVLRPVRALLPRWAILAVGLLIGLSCAVIWPFAKSPGLEHMNPQFQVIVHLQLTISVIRIVYFLVLAACSQLLSIGWKDREVQVATGFGFYALASLSVAVLHINLGAGTPILDRHFHILDAFVGASYIGSMVYWSICFAQKVPERREFTPQMQSFLVSLAGGARSTRLAFSKSSESEADRHLRP